MIAAVSRWGLRLRQRGDLVEFGMLVEISGQRLLLICKSLYLEFWLIALVIALFTVLSGSAITMSLLECRTNSPSVDLIWVGLLTALLVGVSWDAVFAWSDVCSVALFRGEKRGKMIDQLIKSLETTSLTITLAELS